MWPLPGAIRPIARVVPWSVNHRLPSGPAAMSIGELSEFRPAAYSVTCPLGVIRPIAPAGSVNHRLPSGPAAMSSGG